MVKEESRPDQGKIVFLFVCVCLLLLLNWFLRPSILYQGWEDTGD